MEGSDGSPVSPSFGAGWNPGCFFVHRVENVFLPLKDCCKAHPCVKQLLPMCLVQAFFNDKSFQTNLQHEVANEDSNPFAVGSGEGNPFGEEDGLDDDHQNEKPDSTNPFNRCTVQEGQGMSGNPFVFKSEEGQETNPFADKLTRMDGANPFGESAASDCASSSSDQDPGGARVLCAYAGFICMTGNPFELDRQDAGTTNARRNRVEPMMSLISR